MANSPDTVLIVDDSEDFRLLISNYLNMLECTLTFAHDGEDAVELFTSHRYDLIIMDIIMPLMDGVDAIRAIRREEAQKGLRPTPILAISGEGSVETGVDSMDAGATRMINKPITRQGLLNTVRDLLANGHVS